MGISVRRNVSPILNIETIYIVKQIENNSLSILQREIKLTTVFAYVKIPTKEYSFKLKTNLYFKYNNVAYQVCKSNGVW